MIIKKVVTPQEFYNQYLIILNGILKLTEVERNITTMFLLDYNRYSNLDFESRSQLVFSPENRKRIAQELGVTQKSFNNYIVKLRKKGIITDAGINPHIFKEIRNTHIQFIIEIEDEQQSKQSQN